MNSGSTYGLNPSASIVNKWEQAAEKEQERGRIPPVFWGRVTNIADPEEQRRICIQPYWGEDKEMGGGEVQETDWIHQVTDFAGPTANKRVRRFGWDKPQPEVGSLVICVAPLGDPHHLFYIGQPNYAENELAAPGQFKGNPMTDLDWSCNFALPSGYEWGVDVEGNVYEHIPGHHHIKIDGNCTIEVSGLFKLVCGAILLVCLGVLRQVCAKLDLAQYLRGDNAPEIQEVLIETMRPGGRVYKDPRIGKVDDIEE